MNPDAKEMLENILAKDVSSLNGEERAFLFARRSYLNEEQAKRYSALFKEMGAKADGEDVDQGDGLDGLKKPELVALAEANDVDLSGASKNSDRIEALREAGVTA